jgi:dipeptidyl aminopeptidase/acylaminoacyl peptidase
VSIFVKWIASARVKVLLSILLWAGSSYFTVGSADTLSSTLSAKPDAEQHEAWTVRDIVEVTRISSIAIRGTTDVTAFILKQPSIADGSNHFGLYVVDLRHAGRPTKVLEASFLGDLSWHPGTCNWSVRADLGNGVQLYDVAEDGRVVRLVSSNETALVGGAEGLVMSSAEEPRKTGVLSYEWAPDGSKLWYSRIRLRARAEQQELLDQGVRYDDVQMLGAGAQDAERSVQLLGTELRVLNPIAGDDRVVAFAPADVSGNSDVFRRETGSVSWVDSTHIQYRLRGIASGYQKFSLWRVDALTGQSRRLAVDSPEQVYYSVPTPEGALTIRSAGAQHHLVNLDFDGRIVTDYGRVDIEHIGGQLGVWRDERSNRLVLAAGFEDHDGLISSSSALHWTEWDTTHSHLSACAFNSNLSFGACSQETLTLAPQLISVTPSNGKSTVIARPNARYDEVAPLHTVTARWVNRFGFSNTGYVTYPRRYVAGQRYPAIVVTHARDARNRFADDGFQWEFPIQVFAERGYFVLSVNEPLRDGNVPRPYNPGAADVGIARQQFHEAYNPLASMEAAVSALVESGCVDPSRVGIAGYSRGATIARFAMTHSSAFSAASSADATWWDAGGFWGGPAFVRNVYKNLFGGTLFDPGVYSNYLAFSPSARARSFAGPLLQQFTLVTAKDAIEMDQLLKEAQVPTELFVYPSEAHIFWQPRHREAAMTQNLDWFDFWLVGKRNPDAHKSAEYFRWDRMSTNWQLVLAGRAR